LGAALFGGGLLLSRPAPSRPLRRACWYWRHPFRLSAQEQRDLRRCGFERLYVHAATLLPRGSELGLTGRQQWGEPPSCEVHAVFRVHPAANEALLAPGGAERVAARVREAGLPPWIRGVQLDADIPTRRLAAYAGFLRKLRPLLSPGTVLGVTALPDWLRSGDYGALCNAVDEVFPQFYGNRPPEPGKPPPPLWETRGMLAGVRESARGRARIWVGLPAYGRCLVSDGEGRPLGVRHDLLPERFCDDPGWEIAGARTRGEASFGGAGETAVEDQAAFRCPQAALAGPMELGAGSTLVFQWPRAGGLRAAVTEIQRLSVGGVEGVCFFRWPGPGEPLAMEPGTLALAGARSAAGRRKGSEPSLRLSLARHGETVRVTLLSRGSDPPLLGDGVTVEVFPAAGHLSSEGPAAWICGDRPSSPARADRAVLTRPFLRPGRAWEVCRVSRPQGRVAARVRWRDAGGIRREESLREGETAAEEAKRESVAVPAESAAVLTGEGRR
jgi:hypothetical protein